MDNAEKISVPTALSGEVDALGPCVKPSCPGPYIKDAAEYVSVESLPGDQLKQQYHYRYVARSPLILWYWYFGGDACRFRLGPQIPPIYRWGAVAAGRFK